MNKLGLFNVSKFLTLFIFVLIFCGGSVIADDCKPSGDLRYICGPKNVEDILPLGNTQWLIASGMNGQLLGTKDTGHIYLVNRKDKSYEELFPGKNPDFKPDKKMFNACPSPINPKNFSAQGLSMKKVSPNRFRLYMTSHGDREAIEVFDIDIKGPKPSISWTGCVLLPARMYSNGVAILSDGGFVTTKFMDPTQKDPFSDIAKGKITGEVYEWHPHGTVKAVKGTELSGADGIVVSPDNKLVYVAAYGTREIVRYNRTESPVRLKKAKISIGLDNLHWGDDGLIYTAGANYVPPDECKNPPCNTGWSVFSINPETLKSRRITGVDQTATLQNASIGMPVGNEIWIGTYSGDRIGYLPRP